jgi:PAS domain S-box-containing protein
MSGCCIACCVRMATSCSIAYMVTSEISDQILLRAFMEQSPDHVYFKDRQSRFVAVSQSLAYSFGSSVSAIIGKTDADFFDAEQAREFRDREIEIMSGGKPVIDRVTKHTWPDGRETWSLNVALPVRNETGEIVGVLGTNKDVTEKKLLEQALLANRRLEELSARAQEMAEAAKVANEAKSAFLANMSHEIRTPMNGVVGMAELLLDSQLSERQRECAETILHSAHALLTLINEILDLSKIEAGKVELEKADFDVHLLLDEVLRILRAQSLKKNLQLTVTVDPNVPRFLSGDAARIRQALLNLGGNAVKFTQQGEVALTVELRGPLAQNVTLLFKVRDTGIGIPPDRLAALFQPFSQVDVSTTRRFGGTGLGLSIVKRLAELMGGAAGVASREGVGSDFWFEVQLAVTGLRPDRPGQARTAMAGEAEEERVLGTGHRILVVEDNLVNQKVARYALERLGCRVDVVHNGQEGVSAWQRGSYDLILMDCEMPVMDGYDATREIRKQEQQDRHIPIIALTAHAIRGADAKCRMAGMDAYITKPLIRKQLEECLVRFLGTALRVS